MEERGGTRGLNKLALSVEGSDSVRRGGGKVKEREGKRNIYIFCDSANNIKHIIEILIPSSFFD